MNIQKYNAKFQTVKRHIDALDYMSLLSGGCPADEFDGESMHISRQIKEASTVAEIAAIIAGVFEEQFGHPEQPENFMTVAGKIKKDLDAL